MKKDYLNQFIFVLPMLLGHPDTRSVIKLPSIDRLSPRPEFLPFALPEDLADSIERFHGEPAAWWIGQFVQYLMRPNQKLSKYLEERKRALGFSKPIVG
jgi:glycoprotein 6-alpha-L-fucosyltransferase